MNEERRKARNEQRLGELHPPFARRISQVIGDLEKAGYRPRIQEAYRSPEKQLEAYSSGHSKLKYGFHNVTADDGTPESLAVDLYDDDRPLNPTTAYLLQLSAAAWKRGLATGILWGLDGRQKQIVTAAIEARDWQRKVRVGWDPWHIEPSGITVAQAKAGQRPTFA
jgi:hypothetical protein